MQSMIIAKELHLYKDYEDKARFKITLPNCDITLDNDNELLKFTPTGTFEDMTVKQVQVPIRCLTSLVIHTENVIHFDLYADDISFMQLYTYFKHCNVGSKTHFKVEQIV